MHRIHAGIAGLLLLAVAGCGKTSPASNPVKTLESTDPLSLENDDPKLHQEGPLLLHEKNLFTGIVTRHDSEGDLLARTPYLSGKKEGIAITFHPDGAHATEGVFHDNRKSGVHRGWWPNGTLQFVSHYEDDLYEGSVKEWYEDGTPYRFFHYREGKENGPQKMWSPDGTLRANYVLRNKRRYGWIGGLPCTSTIKAALESEENNR